MQFLSLSLSVYLFLTLNFLARARTNCANCYVEKEKKAISLHKRTLFAQHFTTRLIFLLCSSGLLQMEKKIKKYKKMFEVLADLWNKISSRT